MTSFNNGQGPKDPSAMSDTEIANKDYKNRFTSCLYALLGSAIEDGAISQEFADKFNEPIGLALGKRSLTFTCKNGNQITFTQVEHRTRCKFESDVDNASGTFKDIGGGHVFTHSQFFNYYFGIGITALFEDFLEAPQPADSTAKSDAKVAAEDHKFRMEHCFHALLKSLVDFRLLTQASADKLGDPTGMEFGRRRIKFLCADGNYIAFKQSDNRVYCIFVTNVDKASGEFTSSTSELTHREIFQFYFADADTPSVDDFLVDPQPTDPISIGS